MTLNDPPMRRIEFQQLVGSARTEAPLESLIADYGLVYVTSITRDGCSGCEEQKPLFAALAARFREIE